VRLGFHSHPETSLAIENVCVCSGSVESPPKETQPPFLRQDVGGVYDSHLILEVNTPHVSSIDLLHGGCFHRKNFLPRSTRDLHACLNGPNCGR
jgi:hypothetical protein